MMLFLSLLTFLIRSPGVIFAGGPMIETNMQQQQDTISQQLSHPHPDPQSEAAAGTGPAITCSICDAMHAPSPQQAPFLQYAQGVLEATFMGICHFCFRCRRAACPQCWDEMHGVCGSCVQEAGLPFRASATPLDGLMFPPTAQASLMPSQPQSSSLFVPVRNGRFYSDPPAKLEASHTDITTEHTSAIQPQPVATAIPGKTPLPQDTRGQEEAPRVVQKAKKASHLEQTLTWIVLVIVVVLVGVIALAEFIPAVNALVARVTHIDIHAEIAYLVHIVQQFFKR
jgi:hypothetical protein